jgi:CheY-like chemotaxis protein
MSNAFKYTYDGGIIEVRIDQTDHYTAELKVIDNGMGIKGDVNRIFDRFYQGSTSRSLHIEGTGIGLNLCKMIMSMHHGTITAENRTDSSGSIFTVSLPLGNSHFTKEEMEQADPIIEKSSRTKPQTNHRILVVDDDESVCALIKSIMEGSYGIRVLLSGRDAVREAVDYMPDLILLDYEMPVVDGPQVLQMLRQEPSTAKIPIVFLTGIGTKEAVERVMSLKPDGYILKSTTKDNLLKYLRGKLG